MMASHTTLQEKFDELQNANKTPQKSGPKIQMVPQHLRNRKKYKKYYLPKFMSIGPIHHDDVNLKLGEKYKLMWAGKYIEDYGLNPQILYKKIADSIDDLKGYFAEDILTGTGKSLNGFGSHDEKLSWILFVDGCALLHILLDDAFLKDDQHVLVMMDVLLLENQIPYQALKLLLKNIELYEGQKLKYVTKNLINFTNWATPVNETCKSKDNTKNFLKCHYWIWATLDIKRTWVSVRSRIQGCFEVLNKKKEQEEEQQHSVVISIPNESDLSDQNESDLPVHLLDLQRKIILTKSSSKTEGNEANNKNKGQENMEDITKMMPYRNIQDLRAVGIKLKSSKTRMPADIEFSEGWFAANLTLPKIIVDDTTAATFLNLIAFEMCPDFVNDYEISSFAAFMDSLIDHPEDVKELRSKGILINLLGSDEEVADFFNIISSDTTFNATTYFEVRTKIKKHYCNKYKTWIALGIHTYFNNPWTFIAFLAAFVALTLTFVQTWFAINPAEEKK